MELLIILFLLFACAILGAAIGSPTNQAGTGFMLGLILGPIGLVIIAIIATSGKKDNPANLPKKVPSGDITSRLTEAQHLLKSGQITEEEYHSLRRRILEEV